MKLPDPITIWPNCGHAIAVDALHQAINKLPVDRAVRVTFEYVDAPAARDLHSRMFAMIGRLAHHMGDTFGSARLMVETDYGPGDGRGITQWSTRELSDAMTALEATAADCGWDLSKPV